MAGDKAYQFVKRTEGGRRMEALMKEERRRIWTSR